MDAVVNAAEVFFDHIVAVEWGWVVLGVLCHLAKTACRSRAWLNVLAAAYPEATVRWRDVYGAYVAAVGVNAILPARGGSLVRLFLAKRSIKGAAYPTLVSSLAVETVFDLAASVALLVWAAQMGAVPGIDVLALLPALDLAWIVRNPIAAIAIAVGLGVLAAHVVRRYSRHVAAFKHRIVQGFAVFSDLKLYLRSVVAWQAGDWLLRILTIYCFLQAFGVAYGLGVITDLENALLVQLAHSLSSLVPATPAGLGTEQALVAYVLAAKAATASLISFSVGMKLMIVAVNVVLGFGAMLIMLRTLRWRRRLGHEEEQTRPLLGSSQGLYQRR
jgi:uncharacterized membrane protein YbhN (UPF0104 family)